MEVSDFQELTTDRRTDQVTAEWESNRLKYLYVIAYAKFDTLREIVVGRYTGCPKIIARWTIQVICIAFMDFMDQDSLAIIFD